MKRCTAAVAGVLATLVLAPAAGAATGTPDDRSATPVTYGVIGDTPYGAAQLANFPNDVAQISADPKVRLVMHLGDIKNGSSRCDTSYFEQIRSDFDGFKDPLVYTPGDNEWTDCHRANNGGYDPIGRLATLRSLFFPEPGQSLGDRSKALDSQSDAYPENVRWSQSRVVFGEVNIPGSNNDWRPWFGDNQVRTQAQIDEVTNRTAADLEWIDHIFDDAEARGAKAVVLGIQADMWDPAIFAPNTPQLWDHFSAPVNRIADRTRAFDGRVLLLDGDSHLFTDDNPLADHTSGPNTLYGVSADVPNLRRITVNGSNSCPHEYLRLRIDPRSPGMFSYDRVPFDNQPDGCTT